ncbi:MAG: glycerophosphodiester phosphodiesterase [OM182 bacterium MED-G24]|uniref:Glycerophosphodiester phosphodiesterase n=1 Tax=OM182 bacterium MED-G24 TaxID=1986255 RepID=A0A2A5WUM6_9GAMM|nr:MAG: glycerophosphodiester phosphodiesterase [OM182 bacterium MED-G24]
MDEGCMRCIGHRGAMGYEPENTLVSFRKAIEMGCDMVELDVYAVSNQLVVIHDGLVDRTTNGRGGVMSHTFEALRSLDAGHQQQIPTLEEVLELCLEHVEVNIELKGPGTAIPVSRFIDRHYPDHIDQLLLSSFDHNELARADPQLRRGTLFGKRGDYLHVARRLNAYAIHCHHRLVNEEMLEDLHGASLRVYAYTVNDPGQIADFRALGVDGVFTNFPDRVIGTETPR